MSDNITMVCEDCAIRAGAERWRERVGRAEAKAAELKEKTKDDWEFSVRLLDRAQRAEAELRRCYKDIEELTAERNDLKTMLADAGIRNVVLEKRIDRLLDVIHDDCECESFEVCSNHVSGADCATGYDCKKCWYAWLEQEVSQA